MDIRRQSRSYWTAIYWWTLWESFLITTQSNGGCMQISLEVLEVYLSSPHLYAQDIFSYLHLTKAVARGLEDPSFRMIQNHFAIFGNLGEIAVKEEAWEVTAKLMGLAIGILIMGTTGMQSSYDILVYTWLGVRIVHLWLRYQALSVLRFHLINLKRARLLVKLHVSHNVVPGYVDCPKKKNILLGKIHASSGYLCCIHG